MAKNAFNNTRTLTAFWFYPEDLVLITDPEHPLYDRRVLLPINEPMVASIMIDGQGVIEPVVVTKWEGSNDPVVVDGRQRTKNAIEANRRIVDAGGERIKIPAIYKRGTESALYGITITTNEHRIDDDPVEKAAKVNAMLNFGKPKREIAVLFGVTVQTIDNWLTLLEMPVEQRNAVSSGYVKPTAAIRAHKKQPMKKNVVRMRKKKEIVDAIESGMFGAMSGTEALRWVMNNTVEYI